MRAGIITESLFGRHRRFSGKGWQITDRSVSNPARRGIRLPRAAPHAARQRRHRGSHHHRSRTQREANPEASRPALDRTEQCRQQKSARAAAPTAPVITPSWALNRCGTIWKTAPLLWSFPTVLCRDLFGHGPPPKSLFPQAGAGAVAGGRTKQIAGNRRCRGLRGRRRCCHRQSDRYLSANLLLRVWRSMGRTARTLSEASCSLREMMVSRSRTRMRMPSSISISVVWESNSQ